MGHDIIDNRTRELAPEINALLADSIRAHFAVDYFFLIRLRGYRRVYPPPGWTAPAHPAHRLQRGPALTRCSGDCLHRVSLAGYTTRWALPGRR